MTELTHQNVCVGSKQGKQWLRFYYSPLAYIHASWWHTLQSSITLNLPIDDQPPLQTWALQQLQLPDVDGFDYAHPAKSLALLTGSELRLLTRYLGLCLYADSIRTLLLSTQLQAIKQAVGQRGYQFAIHEAPLMLSCWPKGLQQPWRENHHSEGVENLLDRGGVTLLATLFQDSPLWYSKRLILKLPQPLSSAFKPLSTINRENQPIIYRLIQKIVRKVKPECMHLLK